MKQTKKTKRLRASKVGSKGVGSKGEEKGKETEEFKIVDALMEAFSLASMEEAVSAYQEANGDANKAAEILGGLVDNLEDLPSSSCSTSSGISVTGSSAGSYEGSMEVNGVQNMRGFRRSKQKKVVAATGTVSTVLGKEYLSSVPRTDLVKTKDYANGVVAKESEEFLFSMLGNECELSMAVVRDVLCQCQYDVEKALEALFDLSSTSNGCRSDFYSNDSINSRFLIKFGDNSTDRASDSSSHSSESEPLDYIWSMGTGCRNNFKVHSSSEALSTTNPKSTESNLPQKVLETLFNISKSPEREPSTMNWRNVVKKMESLGHGYNIWSSGITEPQQDAYAKGDEYHVFRQDAKQHWESMRSCYQKAAVAYSKGNREYAGYLSEQAKLHTKMAREADEKASHNIFKARNKGIENMITIDLHGQHVKQAMKYLKVHLLLGTYVPSVRTLRVITGCGTHGVGKSLLKQSVIKLLEKEGIKWSEENRGMVLIKLDGQKNFSFLESDSDAE